MLLVSRPFLHEHRCFSGKMDWLPGVCLPSISSGGEVPPKSEERKKLTIYSSPVWPSQAWYPLLLEYLVQSPVLIPMYADVAWKLMI